MNRKLIIIQRLVSFFYLLCNHLYNTLNHSHCHKFRWCGYTAFHLSNVHIPLNIRYRMFCFDTLKHRNFFKKQHIFIKKKLLEKIWTKSKSQEHGFITTSTFSLKVSSIGEKIMTHISQVVQQSIYSYLKLNTKYADLPNMALIR